MKNTKRLLVLATSFPFLCSLVACVGRTAVDNGTDSTKANLFIGTLDAGIGANWLNEACERFNKMYENSTDFEEGKVGVNVYVKADRAYDGTYVLNQSWNHDIMFTERMNYNRLITENKIADITDLVNADLKTYGDSEGKTILSKIDPSYADFLTVDGKVYGIPFYESFYGFVYDVDLWKEDRLYFQKDGTFGRYDSGNLSYGPNGKTGVVDGVDYSIDDGMPATYDQLKTLFLKLNNNYGQSFVISTDESEYVPNLFFNFWAMNEGYDGMKIQYDMESGENTVDNLVKTVLSDGTIGEMYNPTKITKENGYMLTRTKAKYDALKFMADTICSSSAYYGQEKTKNNYAQSYFIESKFTGTACPMCIEGSWFENEARSEIEYVKRNYGAGANYAVMPIPRTTVDEVGTEQTRLGLSASYGVLNPNCKNKKLAYEFLKFLHSDAELVNFTKSTGMTKPMNYRIPDSVKNELSTYTKSLINIKETNKIFYPFTKNKVVLNHYDDFGDFKWAWNTRVNGLQSHNPWTFFRDSTVSADNRTPKAFFDGQYEYYSSNWSNFLK